MQSIDPHQADPGDHDGDGDRLAGTGEQVRRELATQVTAQIGRAQLPLLVTVVVVVAALRGQVDHRPIQIWGAVGAATVAATWIANRIEHARLARGGADPYYVLRNTWHTTLFGLVWGALPVVAGHWGTERSMFIALAVLLALISILVVTSAPVRVNFLCAMAGIAASTVVGLAGGAYPGGWFGALVLGYFAVQLFFHDRMHRIIVDHVRARLDNARLAAQLAAVLEREDPLTRLLNRDGLRAWLDATVPSAAASARLGVAVGNVERLAAINELFGTVCGDGVLRDLADRLRSRAAAGVALARLGGDEFVAVALLDGSDGIDALQDHLVGAVLDPFDIAGQTVDVGLSTAAVVGRPADVEQLVADASSRVRDERSRRSRSLLTADGPLDERRTLLDDVRRGLAAGDVVPWFQPIVHGGDGSIHAWEALARWHHPTRGVLAPGQFLGLVTLGGLMSSLTDQMLAESVRFASRLRELGIDGMARVHVNLGAAELRRPDLPDVVDRLLAQAGVPPAALAIELTEQEVPRIDAALTGNLQRLDALGVRIVVDDFGTGYSSLSHLLDLRVHEVKIDKRFVDGLPDDASNVAVVRAVLGMASGLGLPAVAEGVETEAQATALAGLGCTLLQGYLFSRPVPADAAIAYATGRVPAGRSGEVGPTSF